jgi:tetratricopeptide (TPR) repeat protein
MRRGGVEAVAERATKERANRRSAVIGAVLLVVIVVFYALYEPQTTTPEEAPPLRPLAPAALTEYLEQHEVRAGDYASMFVLSGDVGAWPDAPVELSRALYERTSRWSLEQALPRDVLTAEQVLVTVAKGDERPRLYPLESAVAMVSLLRRQGRRAMVAEAWELGTQQAPPDPSGMLGYFLVATYDDDSEEPTAYFDPWGGRGQVEPSAVRVLRDTEVIGAALGMQAARVFAKSGDGAEAFPIVEAALALDPVSPTLRIVHSTILLESGGMPQALRELEAAIELRPDGPRKLNQAQLAMAQAAMLEANGEIEAAAEAFSEANQIVVDVLESWPRYGRAHLTMATVHLGLGDPERARLELETAESLSPDAPMLWAVWAQYDLVEGEPVAAASNIRRALALDPENWQLQVQAASILARAGDRAGASRHAEEALRLIAPDRRDQLEAHLEAIIGAEAAPSEEDAPNEPTLMLGDPSKLRLRDPDQGLRLDLDE